MSLVDASLDLLSHTSTLYPQTMFNPLCKLVFGALLRLREQLFDSVLARQLHELSLPPIRIDRVLPFSCDWVLVEDEGVWALLLVACRCGAVGDDGGWGPAGEEALERRREGLCELNKVGWRRHGGNDKRGVCASRGLRRCALSEVVARGDGRCDREAEVRERSALG